MDINKSCIKGLAKIEGPIVYYRELINKYPLDMQYDIKFYLYHFIDRYYNRFRWFFRNKGGIVKFLNNIHMKTSYELSGKNPFIDLNHPNECDLSRYNYIVVDIYDA